MKSIRIGLAVFMLALTGLAWVSRLGEIAKDNRQYQASVEEAQALINQGLYQKAILSLENALGVRESGDTRRMWCDTYRLAYEDGVATGSQYIGAMELVAGLQPDNLDNWERLVGFCMETGDYRAAYSYCKEVEEIGVSSGKLAEYQKQVRYSYSVNGKVFTQVLRSPGGYSTVTNGDSWGVLDQGGEWIAECTYPFLSPAAGYPARLTGDGQDLRIVDNRGVVQAILDEEVEAARAMTEGILPLFLDGSWRYYDSAGPGFILEDYEEASSFAGGVAAVKENGSWKLIDKKGNQVGSTGFEDIKLYSNGEYLYDGVFVAKSSGTYGLYNQKAELVASIACSDMDVCFDGGIAYRASDGKWGFMSKKGDVIIEPRYEDAKSFSGGLAAVCVGGQWGFINPSGELVIACQFSDADYFTPGGVCFVSELEGEYYMITLRFHER